MEIITDKAAQQAAEQAELNLLRAELEAASLELKKSREDYSRLATVHELAVQTKAEELANEKIKTIKAESDAVLHDREEQKKPHVPSRPRTFEQWQSLSRSEKAKCIELFPGCVEEVMKDHARQSRVNNLRSKLGYK